jgi:hypothetical protein
MNSGVIRNALTTTLALELEYREPSIFRENWNRNRTANRTSTLRRLFEDEFTSCSRVSTRDRCSRESEQITSISTVSTWAFCPTLSRY